MHRHSDAHIYTHIQSTVPHDLAISLSEQRKHNAQIKSRMWSHKAAFIIAPDWKQATCPSAREWTNTCVYVPEQYATIKGGQAEKTKPLRTDIQLMEAGSWVGKERAPSRESCRIFRVAGLNKLGPSLPVCELPFDNANLKLSITVFSFTVLLLVSCCCFFSLAEVYC